MDPKIRARFTPDRLEAIANEVGIGAADLEDLGGFENFVYAFNLEGAGRILRVGHNRRRPESQVHSELAWLEFLHANGAAVAPSSKLETGSNLVVVDDGGGGAFVGTVFDKAPGAYPEKVKRTLPFYRAYGCAIGGIHALSKRFHPPPEFERPFWNSVAEIPDMGFLPKGDGMIAERAEETYGQIRGLPSDASRFGLIHQDPHVGNMFLDGKDRITLFDFDDCGFGHYAYDIAMALFYATMSDDDPAVAVRKFFGDFLSGYLEKSPLPADCFETIPLFMKLREIDLYTVIHRSFDVATTDDAWVKRFMAGRRERIVDRIPWMDFDFGAFASRVHVSPREK